MNGLNKTKTRESIGRCTSKERALQVITEEI